MVPGVCIKKAQGFAPCCGVDYLFYARKGIWKLFTSFIKVSVIDTHPPFPILVFDKYRVGQPLGVADLFDEPCL
jgi:hypothetical protein